MQATECLLITAGAGFGAAIGFLIATSITAWRTRAACKASWAAAERFYRHRIAQLEAGNL